MAGGTHDPLIGGDQHPRAKYLQKQKKPGGLFPNHRAQSWQRPTLAQPRDALPSALQRFTSVFGMGTGGATARDHQTSKISNFTFEISNLRLSGGQNLKKNQKVL